MSCNVTQKKDGRLAGAVDPEGEVKAWPGDTYLNTETETVWFKKTGEGTKTGWIQVAG